MFRVIRTLGLALGLLGGVIAAQGPEFAQQYAQRLGGTVDELRRSVQCLEADARATGTSRDGAVDRLRGNADALVARRGEAARTDIERLARLSAQQQALADGDEPPGQPRRGDPRPRPVPRPRHLSGFQPRRADHRRRPRGRAPRASWRAGAAGASSRMSAAGWPGGVRAASRGPPEQGASRMGALHSRPPL